MSALLLASALLVLALAQPPEQGQAAEQQADLPLDPPPYLPSARTDPAPPQAQLPTPPLPACSVGDQLATLAGGTTLLDTYFMLPQDFVPADLVALDEVLAPAAPGQPLALATHLLQAPAAAALAELFMAAEAAGVRLAVQSAYRSYAYQQSTFEYWVKQDGYEAALATSARPGHSEHQLGTVIDLRSRSGPPAWELADWADTEEGAWVAANAHLYGFVMSYPKGRQAQSCYAYEPWHYRFVGHDLAETIHNAGVTPRALLWHLQEQARALSEGEPGP